MKIGLMILAIGLISCGKKEVIIGTTKTVDEFTRNYQEQIGINGIAKKGESITLYREMEISYNDNCTYKYAFGERVVLNQNPKLIKIYSKDVYNRLKGTVLECGTSKIFEEVIRVPAVKLQELYIKAVTDKCTYIRSIFDDPSIVSFCSQSFLGITSYRSETAGLFKTTMTLNIKNKTYNVVNDATHLASGFYWVPYPVNQRTVVNSKEVTSMFTNVVTDYYTQSIDERDFDQISVIDYYEGWEL